MVALLSQVQLYEPVLMESGQPGSKHRAGPLNHVSIKPILTRSEPLKPHRVPLSELNSSKPLVKLIKKDQNVL